MSMLTEQEYEEYIRLLRGWVDAEKALEGPGAPEAEAAHRAREAYAAVQTFRERHGLGEAGVAARRLDSPRHRIRFGESLPIEVAVKLNGLSPSDVCVELLLARGGDSPALQHSHELSSGGNFQETGEHRYTLELKPGLSGRLDYRIRIYPRHEALTHPFELGLTRWV